MAHRTILTPESRPHGVPSVQAVHPFGSKILVEVLNNEETYESNLELPGNTKADGAPQAYIIEVGAGVGPETGLKAGQRIYWTGKGTEVKDPRNRHGRVRAVLEIHNVLAVIEDEGC